MNKKILKLIREKYDREDFKYHISAVVRNAVLLAERLGADKEIVEMAAYLHDIGRSLNKDRLNFNYSENNHHIVGEKITREFLKESGYNSEFIEKVCHCVLSHRGRKGPEPQTTEAKIVACADAMAHFDTFLEMFPLFLEIHDSFEKAVDEIEAKIQRNWNKKLTIPIAKEMVKDKYNAIMLLLKSVKEYQNDN